MARVLSALVLLPVVIGAVWFLPPIATLVLALLAAALAFVEYAAIAAALGAHVPRAVSGTAVLAACAAAGGGYVPAEVVLMTAVITIGALAVGSGQPGPAILRDASAALLPVVYIGLPLGALAAVHVIGRPRGGAAADGRRSSSATRRSTTPGAPSDAGRSRRRSARRRRSKGRSAGSSSGRPRWSLGGRIVFPATGVVMLGARRRDRLGARHRRRPVRVAAEAERRREGLGGAHSRPRRRARSHRQLAVRRARLLRLRPLPAVPVTPMKRIAILGSTGSIGQSALAVVAAHPDRLRVVGLAAGENIARFVEQVARFSPDAIAMATPDALDDARAELARAGRPLARTAASGAEGLIAVATHPDADVVLFAIVGHGGARCRARRHRGGQDHRAREQGNPRDGRGGRDGGGAPQRGRRAAGRQRAQRDSPVPPRALRVGGAAADSHRVRRSVSRSARPATCARSRPTPRSSTRRGGWGRKSPSTPPR